MNKDTGEDTVPAALALVQTNNEQTSNSAIDPEGWDAFWLLYPRKVAKRDARRAWSKIDPALHTAVIIATANWRKVWLKRGEIEFIPHPATWLNGERWEDELPASVTVSAAAHVPFPADKPAPARGELPEAVRAMLRKLTGRT